MNHSSVSDDQAAEFAALLGGGKTILVTTHISPDGDAIASLLGAAKILRCLGSRPLCILDAVVPERFRFLPGSETIGSLEQLSARLPGENLNGILVVDSGSLARIGKVADAISPHILLVNVDHHPDNAIEGRLNIVHPEASSTTEILFDLSRALSLRLTTALATFLFSGLMTDTGSFRYPNTTQKAFAVAAELTGVNINPSQIARSCYGNNSLESTRLLGEAIASLQVVGAGHVASMTASRWNSRNEVEDAVDFALTVQGVQVAAFFRPGNGACRVSLRARGPYDVARIARQFGGGGHQKAAGFTYQGHLEDIQPRVIEALLEEVGDPSACPVDEK